LVCLLLLLMCTQGFAKDFPSVNFSQKDGLPSNTIYDVYHDEDGYIWFATSKGVSRYNGVKFENFTTTDGLPDNECFFFRKDKYKRLWIGTFNGTLVFYKDGIFHSAKNTPYLNLPVKTGNTVDIFLEKDSSVTITFYKRNFFVSIKGTHSSHYDLAAFYKHQTDSAALGDLKGIERMHNNAFKLVFANKIVVIDSARTPVSSQDHPAVQRQLIGREQRFYIGQYLYTTAFVPLLKLPEAITDVALVFRVLLTGDNVFICTSKGMYLNQDLCFENTAIATAYRDRDSNFWIGTMTQGVYKLDKRFLLSSSVKDAYKSTVVFAQKAGNSLVVNTRNKNVYVFRNEQLVHEYDFEKKHRLEFHDLNSGNLVHKNSYLNVSPTYAYIINDIGALRISAIDRGNAMNNINSIITCKDYWFFKGRPSILYIKNIGQDLAKNHAYTLVKNVFEWRDGPIYGAAPIWEKNELWFSTFQHVYAIRDTTAALQQQFGSFSFKELTVTNRFFLGYTLDNKLIVADRYQSDSIRFDTSIRNDCVWEKFFPLNDSAILITTNNYYRILTFFPAQKNLKFELTIIENQFIPGLADYIYTDKESIYFFKNQSIFQFPLSELFRKDPPPRLVLYKIETPKKTIKAAHTLHLSFNESREINIRCNVFSLSTNALQYEYALSYDNQDTGKWIISDGPNVRLFKIASGTYTLKIRAKTFAGSYSKVLLLKIVVAPPFWLSWWFICSIIFIVCLAIYLVFRHLIRKKNQEKEREIRFIKSEYRSLNALMNPHFIFNSLNNVQGLINKQDNESASEYIRTISDLIRQNMSNIKNDFIPLDKEVTLIENYLKMEKLRFQECLHYEIKIDTVVHMRVVMIPPLLIQPLVENAIKYGMKGARKKSVTVSIHIYSVSGAVCIDITDNGLGFRVSENHSDHQSTAIKNIRKRLEQLLLLRNKEIRLSIEEVFDEENNVAGVKSSLILLY
jgi:two-component sensor histidine kinase